MPKNKKKVPIWPGLFGSKGNCSSTSRECGTQPRKSRRISEDSQPRQYDYRVPYQHPGEVGSILDVLQLRHV